MRKRKKVSCAGSRGVWSARHFEAIHMNTRFLFKVLGRLGQAGGLCLVAACSPSGADIVVRDVTVLDVTEGSLNPGMNVVIDDGRIMSVSADPSAAGATVVDGSGKFLIPGLWEMHAHVWEDESLFYLYIGAGVTGVRDLGSALEPLRQWEADVEAGNVIGPRIVTAGPPADGTGPNPYPKLPTVPIGTADEGRAAADRLKADGADFVKPLGVPREAYFALAERAREIGIPVAGHVPGGVSLREAVDAGQRTVEHLGSVPLACSSEEAEIWRAREETARTGAAAPQVPRERILETFSETQCREILEHLRRNNVWVTPTLAAGVIRDDIRSGAAMQYPWLEWVPADLRAGWEEGRTGPGAAPTPEQLEQARRNFEYNSRLITLMQEVGVGILAGTDTGDPYVVPGFAVHQELEQLVRAGLTPAQALRTATLEPAKLIGEEATLGSVDPGKAADLVLLNADPLADISNTRRVEAVIVKGNLIDRAELDRMLAAQDSSVSLLD